MKIKTLAFGLVMLLLLVGQPSTAYAVTNSTSGINPQDADVWLNKGNSLYGSGKYEEAIVAYDKAIEINPRFAEAWNNKGGTLYNLGRYEDAITAFDKTLEINPRFAEAWNNKGAALSNLGRYEEAIVALDKAIEINPRYANAWSNKGAALNQLGRYENALKACDKAIEIDPLNAGAWHNKGNAFNGLGRYEDAIAAYNNAVKINPQNADPWEQRGFALIILGRYEDAIASYDKAIEINPRFAVAWNNKGAAFKGLGRYDDAIAAFDKAIEINPRYIEAWKNKGVVLNDQGKYEEAIKAFDKAIEINPQYEDALTQKVNALQNLERFGQEIRIDVYVEPHTGEVINQLYLNIQSLLDTNSISIKPNNIELNYEFEGSTRNTTINLLNNTNNIELNYDFDGGTRNNSISLLNNGYYIGKAIKVDLKQRGDFPFEDYNTTIFISTNDINFTNTKFFINPTNKNMTINSWGQAWVLNLLYEGNKIEITMGRANKQVSEGLYLLGLAIIFSYLISFLIIYRKSSYNSDMFAVFNSFSFLFFVALAIAGIREYLFISKWGILFMVLIGVCFTIFVIKRITSRKQDNISEFKKEHEISELKKMLKQNNEEIIEIKEILKAKLKHDEEGLKPE